MTQLTHQKSILQNHWQPKIFDQKFIEQIIEKTKLPNIIVKLISSRITSLTELQDYIEPKLKNLLPDPFQLKDMEKAVDKLIDTINNKELVYILADYDVDGATSAALMKNVLQLLNVESLTYIPQRDEGYGPNIAAIDCITEKANLLICIDCGSSAIKEFEYAKTKGLQTIILDHHTTSKILPDVVAIVNPNRSDETSNYKHLAAVGVTFLFLIGVITKLKSTNFFELNNLTAPNLLYQLDLVSLGTVCDVVKLDPLNRAFVKQGLKIAQHSKNIGYKTLCEFSLIKNITSEDLAFQLGPKINAGGRIGDAFLGSNLLSTNSNQQAKKFTLELIKLNDKRKELEKNILEEAIEKAELQKDANMIFIYGESWHKGIIGIIASRLKDKYHKLSIVVSITEELGIASCRSIEAVDISDKIIQAKTRKLVIKGGGHKLAGGFSIHKHMIQAFQEFLHNSLEQELKNYQKPTSFYDIAIQARDISYKLLEDISLLEPFGVGNPRPIFKISYFQIKETRIIKNLHIEIIINPDPHSNHRSISAIAFNVINTPIASRLLRDTQDDKLSILGYIKQNIWNNKNVIQIYIIDLINERNERKITHL